MENAYYFGRGFVFFTQPLTPVGAVNNAAYNGRGGTNWPAVTSPAGSIMMPPGRFVGNAKSLEISVEIEQLNVPDFMAQDENGGNYLVKGVTLALTMLRSGSANLADAYAGSVSAAAGQAVTETISTAQASVKTGDMLFSRCAIDLSKPVTLTPSWTAWTDGVDYLADAYGVRMLHGFAGPAGSSIALTYTKEGGAEEIEAIDIKNREVGIVYVGTNLVTGQPARVNIYRAALNPGQKYAPISEQTNDLPIAGTIKAIRTSDQARARWFRIMRGVNNV